MTAFGEELARSLARMNQAGLVLLFGPPDERRTVEQLLNGKLDKADAQSVRDELDRRARNQAS